MKGIKAFTFLLFFLIVSLLLMPRLHSVSDTWDWYSESEGYEEAFAIAGKEGRPIVLYFHVDWCSYCRRFDREYLDDIDVYDFLSDYLRVDINPEDGPLEREIANKYDVKGYPKFLITTPGLEKHWYLNPFKKDGNDQEVDSFIKEMEDAIKYVNRKMQKSKTKE